jgi:hypothetical protein
MATVDADQVVPITVLLAAPLEAVLKMWPSLPPASGVDAELLARAPAPAGGAGPTDAEPSGGRAA